jgi:subfamily B ATP-binding cassette protein MsbA
MIDRTVRRWVAAAARAHPWHTAAYLVLGLLGSVADGLSISLLIPFLAVLFGGVDLGGAAGGRLSHLFEEILGLVGSDNALPFLSFVIVGLVMLRAFLDFVVNRIWHDMGGRISHDVRARIHARLLAVDFEYICVNDNGRLLYTLDGDSWAVTGAVGTVFRLVTTVFMVCVFSGLLLLISWPLTFAVAAAVAVISLGLRLFSVSVRRDSETALKAGEALSTRAVELFDAMRMIRAFGREARAQAAYEQASLALRAVSVRMDLTKGASRFVQEAAYALLFVGIIFAGLAQGMEGASLIAYLALLHRLQPHVRALDDARMHLAGMSASIHSVSTLLDLPTWTGAGAAGTRQLPAISDAIRFDRVTFAYRGRDRERRYALEDVTIAFPIGKVTAVVGWSGAGKSTLTNLLFRFYDPVSGTISVDGVPLEAIDLDWWRGRLAIAGQDADLIGGTLAENIAYGKADATEEEIVEAARQAAIHDFIAGLPSGYDTRVGDRGVLLSGGQRQRVGLARALIRQDAILVLDEATNSLDSLTEQEVMSTLASLKGRRTVIVIAHRLSTTKDADQVVVLAGGKVTEVGAPQDLYRRDGLFAKMVRLQELSSIVADPRLSGTEPVTAGGAEPFAGSDREARLPSA